MPVPLLHTYRIGPTLVEVWADNVRTNLPDGRTVTAADTDMARCIDHELAHTWIAWHYTRQPSRTLTRVANPAALVTDHDVAHEEHIVLAYTAGLTGTYRPWHQHAR